MALDLKYPLTVEAKSEKIAHKESAPKWLISKWTFGARGSLPPVELTWYDGNKRPSLQKEHNMPDWPEATIFVGSKGMMNMAPAPIRLQKHIVVHGDNLGKENPCHIVVDEAISWLDENRNPDKPFFQNIWFHEPHAPIAAPDEIVSRYGKRNDPAAIYSGTIDNTDRAITRLLAKLEQIDSPENTLIVYSSDNGSYRADRVGNLRSKKGPNFEGGIRVPGIFSWPGTITKAHVEHAPAGLVDLLPTICGLLGIDKPANIHLDGSDLSGLLTGSVNEFTRHQPLFWLLQASAPAVAIRDGDYSLVA